MMGFPLVFITGRSGTGKTTLMEALINVLSGHGYRVATIKHTRHEGPDLPGKDTWRHARAGAVGVALVAGQRLAVFLEAEKEPGPAEVAAMLPAADIILAEGYWETDGPRIEVVGPAGPRQGGDLLAVVGEDALKDGGEVKMRAVQDVAALLEKMFLKNACGGCNRNIDKGF